MAMKTAWARESSSVNSSSLVTEVERVRKTACQVEEIEQNGENTHPFDYRSCATH